MANHLFYGDNLDILRTHIKNESIDLIYLDPPFNSQATYNVLFRSPAGEQSKYPYISFGMKSNRILIGSFHAFPDGLLRSPKKP